MANKKISQNTLAQIAKKRALIEQLQEEVKIAENTVLESLRIGHPVAPGLLTARIKTWEQRAVAWKEVCVRELGQEYVDRVFNATKPSQYKKLVVEVG